MWRNKGWTRQRNRYLKQNQPLKPYYKTRQKDYEAGADAMLKSLKDMDGVEILVAGEWYKASRKLQQIAQNAVDGKGRLVFIEEDNEENAIKKEN